MKTITTAELEKVLAAKPGAAVIDVRTPAEFTTVHVPQAVNMPLDTLDAGKLPKAEPVYILCQSGNRAKRAAEQLVAAGIGEPVVVEGGTKAWDEAGLPVVRGRGVISIERQVRIAAGSLVLLGLLLTFLISGWFLGLTAFVGAGLVFAGVTDWCGMALLLAKAPWNRAA